MLKKISLLLVPMTVLLTGSKGCLHTKEERTEVNQPAAVNTGTDRHHKKRKRHKRHEQAKNDHTIAARLQREEGMRHNAEAAKRDAQIASDRKMAERLQREEINRAEEPTLKKTEYINPNARTESNSPLAERLQREQDEYEAIGKRNEQIENDRKMAERLQSEENESPPEYKTIAMNPEEAPPAYTPSELPTYEQVLKEKKQTQDS